MNFSKGHLWVFDIIEQEKAFLSPKSPLWIFPAFCDFSGKFTFDKKVLVWFYGFWWEQQKKLSCENKSKEALFNSKGAPFEFSRYCEIENLSSRESLTLWSTFGIFHPQAGTDLCCCRFKNSWAVLRQKISF